MMRILSLLFFIWCFLFFSEISFAKTAAPSDSFGEMAIGALDLVSGVASVIYKACFILGGGFLFAGVIKYFEHRTNPLGATWSTIIFLFVGGLLLILLPFVSYYVGMQ